MNTPLRPPASAVPTLTDVVGFETAPAVDASELERTGPTSAAVLPLRAVPHDAGPSSRPGGLHEASRPGDGPPAPATVTIDEELLIQQVLVDVQRQVDRMFEFRVRETIGPAFARLLEGFIQETRHDLELTLRDVVRRAVAQELARHRPR